MLSKAAGDDRGVLVVVFDEEVNTAVVGGKPGLHSVENLNNWALVNGRNEELAGVLTAISIVSKRLAARLTALERKREANPRGGKCDVTRQSAANR